MKGLILSQTEKINKEKPLQERQKNSRNRGKGGLLNNRCLINSYYIKILFDSVACMAEGVIVRILS